MKIFLITTMVLILATFYSAHAFAWDTPSSVIEKNTKAFLTLANNSDGKPADKHCNRYKAKNKQLAITQITPLSIQDNSQNNNSSLGVTFFTRDGHRPSTGLSALFHF